MEPLFPSDQKTAFEPPSFVAQARFRRTPGVLNRWLYKLVNHRCTNCMAYHLLSYVIYTRRVIRISDIRGNRVLIPDDVKSCYILIQAVFFSALVLSSHQENCTSPFEIE